MKPVAVKVCDICDPAEDGAGAALGVRCICTAGYLVQTV